MKMILKINNILYLLVVTIFVTSCLDFVEDGYDIEYADSNAAFQVTPLHSTSAAANETVSFVIKVVSSFDIKSCIVRASVEGKNGSGFNVSYENFDDPFADHNYGTIRPGIKSFEIRYDYIVPDDLNKSRISFTVIDESGKVKEELVVQAVPSITIHKDLVAYAKDNTFHDAIAASEGQVYENIKDEYSRLTAENVAVQEKIDIIFFYDEVGKSAIITSPASGWVNLDLSIENNTLFKRLESKSEINLNTITAGELEELTASADLLKEGSQVINGVKVGDLIGFIADVNALNSLKKGLLLVKGLHPGNVERYDGLSYVIECDILIQN